MALYLGEIHGKSLCIFQECFLQEVPGVLGRKDEWVDDGRKMDGLKNKGLDVFGSQLKSNRENKETCLFYRWLQT